MKTLFLKNPLGALLLLILLLAADRPAQAQIGSYDPTKGSMNLMPGQSGSVTLTCFVPLPTSQSGTYYFLASNSGASVTNSVTVSATSSGMSYTTSSPGTPFYFNGNDIKLNATASSSAPLCGVETITINLYKYNGGGYYHYCTFTLTVFCRNDAKDEFVVINSGMYYVTDDFKIARQYWDPFLGWQYQTITPIGGWGSVQVDGWLAADYNYDQIYFKGMDDKVYNLYRSGANWYVGPLSSNTNVAGCIRYRASDGLFYIGTDSKIHHLYWSSGWQYEAITPWSGWTVLAAGMQLNGTLNGASLELADGSSNVFFRGNDSKIYNLVGSTGSWGLGLISPTGAALCAGDMTVDNTGLYYKGNDNFVHKLYWNSGWVYDAMTPSNLSTGNARGDLSKFPGENRVFYKGTDNLLYNIYWTGSQWDVFPLDYGVNTVAGDVLAADGKVFFMCTDKRVHNFWWNGSAWIDNALVYSVANAKGCSSNYRFAEETSAEPATALRSSIYPNPGSGLLSLSLEAAPAGQLSVSVYSSLGESVRSMQLQSSGAAVTHELRFDDLAKGLYLLLVEHENGQRETHRLVIN